MIAAYMKISIDSTFLYTSIGFGTYTRNLVMHLMKHDRENQYYLLANRLKSHIPVYDSIDENIKHYDISLPANFSSIITDYTIRQFWAYFAVPRIISETGSDIFHSVDNISGRFFRKNFRLVLTVHDIIPVVCPDLVKKMDRLAFYLAYPQALNNADRIITGSESAKNDLIERYSISEKKISVIYDGCDHDMFKPSGDKDKIREVCRKYGIDGPFLFNLSSASPRRNLMRLLKAYKILHKRGYGDFKLVLGGSRDFKYEELYRFVQEEGLEDRILTIGYVSQQDLPFLYNGAELFIYPSLYEGFGLTVLEAMACGTPVITSNLSSLPEVVGNSGLLIDPFSVEEIAESTMELLDNHDKRKEMSLNGIKQSKIFDWNRTTLETIEVYKNL